MRRSVLPSLVTVFNSLAGHAQLVPGRDPAASVHSLDDVFAVAGLFALGALATVVFGVRRPAASPAVVAEREGARAIEQRSGLVTLNGKLLAHGQHEEDGCDEYAAAAALGA